MLELGLLPVGSNHGKGEGLLCGSPSRPDPHTDGTRWSYESAIHTETQTNRGTVHSVHILFSTRKCITVS